MKIIIAGCRGSIPSPSGKDAEGKEFRTEEFGGNTTCYYLQFNNGKKIIIDAGTGIASLGRYLMRSKENLELDLYITHTHWDHIQGFPFFVPAYIKGNKIDIYGEAQIKGELIESINRTDINNLSKLIQVNGIGVKEVFRDQQKSRNFPAPVEYMAGIRGFYDFIPGGVIKEDNCLKIETRNINHPGGCVSYKFHEDGKIIVVSTDFEPDENGEDDKIVEFWKNSDLVIADSQYETNSKNNPFMKGWGHSDAFKNLEIARKANVKRIIMTHHDPKSEDVYLRDLESRVRNASCIESSFAREGEVIVV